MKEFAIILAPVILNAIITAVFTFIITRKIDKSSKQSKIIFEELENIAVELNAILLDIISDKSYKNTNNNIKRLNTQMNKIYLFGTIEAVRIVAYIRKLEKQQYIISLVALLISQIRYDLTSKIINPIYWPEINLTDFSKYRDEHNEYLKKVIKHLKLNKNFLKENTNYCDVLDKDEK
ncbi:hypothetical protein NEI00_02080 [Brachyspira pilosicoli]|uniref:Uncharacterized protein n=1 Tax=Brachyspira pilosicoli B2904 TaxID=1133568 RepID=J9UU71_BRAPL|nr:hypothetical protein [Brachyspira pilosicoli]AFR70809.1 hypothetical protein B2904_orf1474 [Brachyspira pilosicoli B2904]WIH83983.1 hypothetical protein NEI00_02080 [Brachyspira pilosicoli]